MLSSKLCLTLFALIVAIHSYAVEKPYHSLTEEDFERARTMDWVALSAKHPLGGGPLAPIFNITDDTKAYGAIWQNGNIPYTISSAFNSADVAGIAAAIQYLNGLNACIKFVEDNSSNQYKVFINSVPTSGNTCQTTWSYPSAGKTSAQVGLSPQSGCTMPRTVAHELMHGISMFHTHTRSDRDSYVTINTNNIISGQASQFSPCTSVFPAQNCQDFGQSYDCASVMHYASDQMSTSPNKLFTIVAKNPSTCVLYPYSQWNTVTPYLSASDVALIKNLYCKNGK